MSTEIALPILTLALFITCLVLQSISNNDSRQRKKLETVITKLRDKEVLNEQEVEIYMTAKKYDFSDRPTTA